MVDAAAIADRHTIVAIGATGGVGSYLVQLATARGARVVAICSGANADYARTLGAADVIARLADSNEAFALVGSGHTRVKVVVTPA